MSVILGVFLRVVYGSYRRQAKQQGHAAGRCGSVSFVQRFGSALNLNPHYHVLMPDGVYVTGQDGAPMFVRAPQLTDDDVQRIVETTAQQVVRLLQRRGVLEQGNVDPLWEQEPLLATITAASVQGQIAIGERAGQRVRRRLADPEEGIRTGPLCFASRGFSLHAPRVEATDRERLERLCRYVMRPPPGRRPAADPRSRACRLRLEVRLLRRHLSDPPVAHAVCWLEELREATKFHPVAERRRQSLTTIRHLRYMGDLKTQGGRYG